MNIENLKENQYEQIKKMVEACSPLDVHTLYTYWVLARYFTDTSFVLYDNDEAIGFIIAITKDNVGFIWQIGVLPQYRKQDLSYLLIDKTIQAFKNKGINDIELTIDTNNQISFAAFNSYCKKQNLKLFRKEPVENQYKNEIIYKITI